MVILTMEEHQKAVRKVSSHTMRCNSTDLMCPVHHDKCLEFFCGPCDEVICGKCMMVHRVHGKIEYATIVLEQRVMKLKDIIPDMEEVQSNGKSMLKSLRVDSNELMMTLGNELSKMESYFSHIHGILNDKEKEIVIEMETEAEKKRKPLEMGIVTMTQAVERVKKSKLVLQDAVNKTTMDVSLLLKEKEFRIEINVGTQHMNEAISDSEDIQDEFTDLNPFVPNNNLEYLCLDLQYRTEAYFQRRRHRAVKYKSQTKDEFDCLSHKLHKRSKSLMDCRIPGRGRVSILGSKSTEILTPVSVIESKDLIGPYDEKTVYPNGIFYLTKSTLLVTDSQHHSFRIITSTGKCIRKVGSMGRKDGQFYEPRGITLDLEGNILVLDGKGTGRIQKFSDAGNYLSTFQVRRIIGPYYMDEPIGVVVLTNGDVLVTDGGKSCVHIFNASGKYQGKFGNLKELKSPAGIAASETNVVMADKANHCIFILNHHGNIIHRIGKHGTQPGEFNIPYGIAIHKDGHILVSESGNHRISVFTQEGEFVRCFGGKGSESGKFSTPRQLSIDHQGLLVVCDEKNHRLQFFKDFR